MIFTLSECSHGRANSTSPLRWSRACQHVAPCFGPETDLCIRRRKLRQSAIMLNSRALDQLAKPGTLRPGIAWKIEPDGDPFRQKSTNVGRESVLQPGRAFSIGVSHRATIVQILATYQPSFI